jgi:hypothetical protein
LIIRRKIYDEKNQREYVLTNDDLSVIINIEKGKFPNQNIEMYRDYVDWVKYDSRFPLRGNERSKQSFLPNKDDEKKVVEYYRKIKRGINLILF